MKFRYLTFEISRTCNLSAEHPRCPVNDPLRYSHGRTDVELTDALILSFWDWCCGRGFSGVVLWHLYCEPSFHLRRIHRLMEAMRQRRPQACHLWTNMPDAPKDGFENVHFTDYRTKGNRVLDGRMAMVDGAGNYAFAPSRGACSRVPDYELLIDNHANWLLCCADWRCEESVGNIALDEWGELERKYSERAGRIAWQNRQTYDALPRLCRACLTTTSLSRSAEK